MTLVERLRSFSSWMISFAFGKIPDEAAMCLEAADRIEALEAENKALRQIVHETASALPNGAFIAPSCSVEFMAGLPNEVKSVCSTLEAELEKAREALEPFAVRAGALDDLWKDHETHWIPEYGSTKITIGDLRRAREVFRSLSHKEG